MNEPTRSSDIKEILAAQSVFFIGGAILLIGFGAIFIIFRGDGYFVPLGWILTTLGLICLVIGIWGLLQTRKVKSFDVTCPYCSSLNTLTEPPQIDFRCISCSRMIPIEGGKVMPVKQVRCGFCQALNYYCDKTEVLICEECNHEIPILQDEEGRSRKQIPKAFQMVDDDALYELTLMDPGKNIEDLISALQHMLALNRNQVKEMLETLPVNLLQGINRKKAEILKAQLTVHGAIAEFHQMDI